MTVDILMATYNGSRHLRNQLLSLQQQTYENWTLWIRDDGSTDHTLEIINTFANLDPRIRLIENTELLNLGPAKSFLLLTKNSAAPYTIFCDQDDIWFEKKLEELVIYADSNFDPQIPSLVYCDGHGYSDEKGVITLQSISRAHATDLKSFLFFNAGYQGCSMLFNRRLCSLAANYRASYFYMHDDIVSLLAHSFGKVHFLPKALMLYRQHAKNVTGNIQTGLLSLVSRAINRERPVLSARHYEEKKAFFEAYRSDLSLEDQKLFTEYIRFPSLTILGRMALVIRNGFSSGGNMLTLLAKTAIRRPLA